MASLLGPSAGPVPGPSGQEGVGQIQVGVVSLVSAPACLTSAVHQGLLGGRGQVTRQAPGVTMAMMEAEQTVVRVQARHQAGVERGWEVTSGEARPQRSRRCGEG